MVSDTDIEISGEPIASGKTKELFAAGNGLVLVCSKDDLTAGDGRKHIKLPGKGAAANEITCNTFALLNACGNPLLRTAFVCRYEDASFISKQCTMVLLEVVVRRSAHGSYLKRNPSMLRGKRFDRLVFELYLKTSGKVWNGQSIPCDDPLMIIQDGKAQLYLPTEPVADQQPFLVLDEFPLSDRPDLLEQIEEAALRAFLVFEKAWQLQGGQLCDYKIEFGFTSEGQLVIADVIDADSWRVWKGGAYFDKQIFRDRSEAAPTDADNDVALLRLYQETARITGGFRPPHHFLVDIKPFASTVIGTSQGQLAAWVRNANVSSVMFGSTWVSSEAEIRKYLEEHTQHGIPVLVPNWPGCASGVPVPPEFEQMFLGLQNSMVSVALPVDFGAMFNPAVRQVAQFNAEVYSALRYEYEQNLPS